MRDRFAVPGDALTARAADDILKAYRADVDSTPAPPKQQQVARTVEREPLSADELRSAMAGNSVYVGAGGSEFAAYHNSDGSLAGRAWGTGQEQTGNGSWKIDEKGQYCRKWDNSWSGGQWGCFKVYKEGEQLQMERVSGAGANGPMKLESGNPHDLSRGGPFGAATM